MLHNIWYARIITIIVWLFMFLVGFYLMNNQSFKINKLLVNKDKKQMWQNICALILLFSLLSLSHTCVFGILEIDPISSFSVISVLSSSLLFLLELCFKSNALRFFKLFLCYITTLLIFIFASFDISLNHEWIAFIICYIPTFISMFISAKDILKYNPQDNIPGVMLYICSSLWALILMCFEP